MPTTKPKVAIVDDDVINLDLLCCELSDQYELYPISDGLSSLQQFEEIMPDLIILDIMMPAIDGVSVYIAKQQNDKLQHIPVIFVTAIDDVEYKVQLLEWGVEDYITKPYDMSEIRARIHNQLQRAAEKKLLKQQLEEIHKETPQETGRIG